jgi:hypothetical protein
MSRSRIAVVAVLACRPLWAHEGPKPPEQQDPVVLPAPPTPVDDRPHTLPLGKPRSSSGALRTDPRLGRLRAIDLREGEARLVVADAERTLHVGDVVAGDVVKIIEPGRLVLARPDPESGLPSIVIVKFDEKGRGHVTVYAVRDTSPAAPAPPSRE